MYYIHTCIYAKAFKKKLLMEKKRNIYGSYAVAATGAGASAAAGAGSAGLSAAASAAISFLAGRTTLTDKMFI